MNNGIGHLILNTNLHSKMLLHKDKNITNQKGQVFTASLLRARITIAVNFLYGVILYGFCTRSRMHIILNGHDSE